MAYGVDVGRRFLEEEVSVPFGEGEAVGAAEFVQQAVDTVFEGLVVHAADDVGSEVRVVAVVVLLLFRVEDGPLAHEHIDFQVKPLVHDEIVVVHEMDGLGGTDEPGHGAAFHDALVDGVPEFPVLVHIGAEEGKQQGPENQVVVKETGAFGGQFLFCHIRHNLRQWHEDLGAFRHQPAFLHAQVFADALEQEERQFHRRGIMEIGVAEGKGIHERSTLLLHLVHVPLRFPGKILRQRRQGRPGFPGKISHQRNHRAPLHDKGRFEREERPAHIVKFIAEGPGNIEIQTVLHRFRKEIRTPAVPFHHERSQLQPEMDILPDDAVPYLPDPRRGKPLLLQHGSHRPVHGHTGKDKTFTGQRIKPAVHVGKQEADHLFLLFGHLFIMHEGHLLSRERKGNFLYYTTKGPLRGPGSDSHFDTTALKLSEEQ